jgi:uncharacterized damage-inducible protein DinB
VGDLKPPRSASDERDTLMSLLDYQRQSVVRKLEGLDQSQIRWSPVPTGTSLLWLVAHLTRAEALWVLRRFAGRAEGPDTDQLGDADTAASVIAAYQEGWAAVDAVIESHDLDEVAAELEGLSPVNLRWIVMHLLEETARHAGHADLIREQIDGVVGR